MKIGVDLTLGTEATVVVKFRKNGALDDPGSIVVTIIPPSGAEVVGVATRVTTGTYLISLPLTMIGEWTIRVESTDPVEGAAETTIVVRHSRFAA